jgi:hypothetical protein
VFDPLCLPFTVANVGQNIDFFLKNFMIVVESNLALERNTGKFI